MLPPIASCGDGEFSNSIEMPSFEAEFILRNGGDGGHVRFGHSYSFAAGYVYILMAALAGICLARSVRLFVPATLSFLSAEICSPSPMR